MGLHEFKKLLHGKGDNKKNKDVGCKMLEVLPTIYLIGNEYQNSI